MGKKLGKEIGEGLMPISVKRNAAAKTAQIIGVYLAFGIAWILGSDYLVEYFLREPELIRKAQTLKGVFYVAITALVFSYLIFRSFRSYLSAIDSLEKSCSNLNLSHKKTKELDNQLFELAYYDPLTKLPNKTLLEKTVSTYIANHPKDGVMGLVYFDLDEFRNINEVKGHAVGDELLVKIADTLSTKISSPNMLARISGDEFVIAMFGLEQLDKFLPKVEYYINLIRKSFILDHDHFFITYSAGVTLYPDHGKDYLTLLRHADAAHSMAKAKGKDQIVVFDDEMISLVKQKTELLNELRNAISNNEFYLHYQPIIDLTDNSIMGVEALIRWVHPVKGFIAPLEFISLSEKSGFIKEITDWVFKSAAENFSRWEAGTDEFFVSINISAVMLMSDYFIPSVGRWIEESKIDCTKYIFEITETMVIDDIQKSIHVLNQLRELGFRIALDDFGTGYSSLTYLQKLPIDIIKIDRTFIANIQPNTDEFYVLKYMIELAHHLNLKVVAEGIETEEQAHLVKKYGVDSAQGYFYCRPIQQERVLEYFKDVNKKNKA